MIYMCLHILIKMFHLQDGLIPISIVTLSICLILIFILHFLPYHSINLYRYQRILIVSTFNPKSSYKAVCDVERNFNNPSFQFYFELLISLVYLYRGQYKLGIIGKKYLIYRNLKPYDNQVLSVFFFGLKIPHSDCCQ